MKYFLICGEASGDLHSSNLIKELKVQDPDAEIWAWGGKLCQEAGATVLKDYGDIAVMGFAAVIANLFKFKRLIQECADKIEEIKPDAVIFVDFSGFNMRVAEKIRPRLPNTKLLYYIVPKVWAWNQGRVKKMAKILDYLYVILPFEQKFFTDHGCKATYVGNSVKDALRGLTKDPDFKKKYNIVTDKPLLALLPGSRKGQILNCLNPYLQAADLLKDKYYPVVAATSQFSDEYYQQYAPEGVNFSLVRENTYQLLLNSEAAIVTSGTASLETALLKVPQVMCYKTSNFNYFIAKSLLKIPWIGLVNLIANKEVLRERIQKDMSPEKIAAELSRVKDGGVGEQTLMQDYEAIDQLLGDSPASYNTANAIVSLLKH